MTLVLAAIVVVAVTAALLIALFWFGHLMTRGTSDDLLGLICCMWVWDAVLKAMAFVLRGAIWHLGALFQAYDE